MDSVLIHDVRNVGQRLNLLLANLEEHYGDPDFKRSVVELISSTLEKLDGIAGRYASHQDALLVKVELDVNDLISEVVRGIRTKAGTARARLVTDLGETVPVWGDAHYLKDAFSNVIQNALEAAETAVRVATRVERRRKKASLVVTVEDDGPGMTPEFVNDRLFRPFQTTKAAGVGLGLYTARQILGFHGGTIAVESAPGQGTRFILTLPGEA